MPRNSARNSLTIPCLSAQWCLMLPRLVLRVAVSNSLASGSLVMLPKFRALAPHLHLGGPTRSHSAPTIDLITQQSQPPLSFAPRPRQTDDQQHHSCILNHFVFIPISLIHFRGVGLCHKQRVDTGSLFYSHLFTIFPVCTVLSHTIRE